MVKAICPMIALPASRGKGARFSLKSRSIRHELVSSIEGTKLFGNGRYAPAKRPQYRSIFSAMAKSSGVASNVCRKRDRRSRARPNRQSPLLCTIHYIQKRAAVPQLNHINASEHLVQDDVEHPRVPARQVWERMS